MLRRYNIYLVVFFVAVYYTNGSKLQCKNEEDFISISCKASLDANKLQSLSLSNLQITKLNDDLFESLKDLLLLDLSSNQLKAFGNRTFKDLKSLTELNVSVNSLKHIQNDFSQLCKLQDLNLSHNRILTISESSFNNLTELKKLDLGFNQLISLNNKTFQDLANLQHLNLNNNLLTEFHALLIENLIDLRHLTIENNAIRKISTFSAAKRIPSGHFPNLSDLNLSGNRIDKINMDFFHEFPGVKFLNLSRNNIIIVISGVFQNLTSLETIDMRQNKLILAQDSFRGLPNLKDLFISDNLVESTFRSLSSFVTLEGLRLTNQNLVVSPKNSTNYTENDSFMKHENVSRLSKELFIGKSNLTELNLNGSGIIEVESDAFGDLKMLIVLNLGYNQINIISNSTFEGLERLQNLDLQFNPFTSIPLFQNLTNLLTLNLRATNIENLLPEIFLGLKMLKELNLGNNKIESIAVNSFKYLEQLKVLNLTANQIKNLNGTSLGDLKELESLDLSFNKIENIQNDLKSLEKLKHLTLSNNKIRILHPNFLQDSIQLKHLDLSQNNIKNIGTSLSSLINLLDLDLNHNELTEISYKNLEFLESLTNLNLSSNFIDVINATTFSHLEYLQKIDLQNNRIKKISIKSFSNLSILMYLNLKDNLCISRDFGDGNTFSYVLSIRNELLQVEDRITKSDCNKCLFIDIENGYAEKFLQTKNFTEDTFVDNLSYLRIVCEDGYSIAQETDLDNIIICKNEQWNKPNPVCVKSCPDILTSDPTIQTKCYLKGKLKNCEKLQTPGTIANISCNIGYQLLATNNDSSLLTCLDDGNWDAEPITCSPVCGRLTAKAQALVIGGDSSTGISDVPWQTAIYKESKKATKLICGGSILTKKVIISAAHCFFNDADSTWINKTRIKIIVGKYFRNYTAEENLPIQHFEVQEIKPNPVFNGFSGFYRADIALIILKGFISFQPHILPICIDLNEIDDRVVKAGEMGLVAGWGYTEAGGQLSRILKSIEMPVIDLEKCRLESGNFLPFVTSDKYCSGFTNGSGVCKGDSGGGMAFLRHENDESVYFIKGIVSNGKYLASNTGCDNFYTLFLNILEYVPFIKTIVNKYP